MNWGVKGQVQGVGASMNQSSILCLNLSMCIFLSTRDPPGPQILRQVPGLSAFQNPQPIGRSQLCLISPPVSIFECCKVEKDRFWLNPTDEASRGLLMTVGSYNPGEPSERGAVVVLLFVSFICPFVHPSSQAQNGDQ